MLVEMWRSWTWWRRTSHDRVGRMQLPWVSCFNGDHNDATRAEDDDAAMAGACSQ